MVTTVGLHPDIAHVLKGLIELEYDAIAAYEEAIERFNSPQNKQAFQEFVQDHHRHLQELKTYAQSFNVDIADGPDMKAILTKGKIVIADLMGDDAILMAMKTNEDDTVTAYERACKQPNLPQDIEATFQKGYQDETRHRSWMVQQANAERTRAA